MAQYESTSPYNRTTMIQNQYLDTVQTQYTYRPDLLAYDLYGSEKLWWVFAQRNMDVIKDPVYDLVAGVKIYLPKGDNLAQQLGV
jgi:hypothetical protein